MSSVKSSGLKFVGNLMFKEWVSFCICFYILSSNQYETYILSQEIKQNKTKQDYKNTKIKKNESYYWTLIFWNIGLLKSGMGFSKFSFPIELK